MTFSPLADMGRRIPDVGRSSPRQSAITGLGIHHNAGVNAFGQATAPGREVSANYWITNEGAILPNIDEERRAFTSGHPGFPAGAAADHRNITVEVSNSPQGEADGSWAISDAAMNALIALIADVYRRYGLGPVTRGADRGVGVHRDWVSTECPGPYVMGHLAGIITAAEQLRTGGAAVDSITAWEDSMKQFTGRSTRSAKQKIKGGALRYITFKDSHDQDDWGDRTIARGPGYIAGLEVNVTVSGTKGARLACELVKEIGENKKRVRLANPRATVDSYGRAGLQIGWSGYLAKGELIRLLIQPEDGETLTVEEFYWSGLNRPGTA